MSLKKPPSMRQSKRYLIFQLHSEGGPASFPDVKNAIWNSVLNWLGENDASKADIHIIKNLWRPGDQTGFIRCHPKYVDALKIALALIHQIGDQRVAFQTLRVSGTIKSGKASLA